MLAFRKVMLVSAVWLIAVGATWGQLCTETNPVSCYGGSDGEALVTPTGGVSPYTYLWNDPSAQTTAIATGLTAGTYTVIVTDAEGAQTTCQVNITEPSTALSCTAVMTNAVTYFGGSDGAASVTPTGGWGSYTYSWSPSGGTAATATGLTAGTYTVTVTDAEGCQTTCQVEITQPASALSCTAAMTNAVTCFGGSDGAASVTPTGGWGSYTYSWSPSGGTAATATGLTAGTYTVTVTDAEGAQTTCQVDITQPASALSCTASMTNAVTYFGGSDGAASVTPTGGWGSYTYSWSPSGGTAATATGLTAGTYTVTVTDAEGCQTTCQVEITQPASALSCTTAMTNAVTCFGGSDGAASVTPTGGWGSYTYSWSPSGGTAATATDLTAGTYTVTVTDAEGAQTTCQVDITQPVSALSCTASMTNAVTYFGGSDGAASVTPTGGWGSYTYSWSPSGGTAATATGLTAGTYTVTVTDAEGCQTTCQVEITQPASALSCTAAMTNAVTCFGGSDGAASVTPTGGWGSYTYSWSPSGGTAATATGLTAGTYTVTVTDAEGAQTTCQVEITEPAVLIASIIDQTQTCSTLPTGTATLSASGGTPPFEYSGDGIIYFVSPVIAGLGAGIHTVYVRDNNNCISTINVDISTFPVLLPGSINIELSQFCVGGTTPIGGTNPPYGPATGGSGSLTYTWQIQVGCTGLWVDISGTNTTSYTPVPPATTACYRRKVTDDICLK